MDDFSALAQRISLSVREVRGCLILSRDGLVLGAFPDDAETLAKPAWLKFVALGEADKSFVEFTDQVWAYVKRGTYAAFAIAEAGCRPGILVDQLDQILLSAEEARTRRDTLKVPDAPAAPSGKPRTSLHPPPAKATPEPMADVSAPAAAVVEIHTEEQPGPSRRDPPLTPAEVSGNEGVGDGVAKEPATSSHDPAHGHDESGSEPPPSTLSKEPKRLVSSHEGRKEEESEVDRVLLAQEFSGLLQVDMGDDEASS